MTEIEVIGYGAIGLSWTLAGLSYKLLLNEQNKQKPRKNMINSIYIFMFMSFMLSVVGFCFELTKEDGKNKYSACEHKVVEIKKILNKLTSENKNLIHSLENIKLNDKQDEYIIRSVINGIKEIDDTIKEEKK